MSSIKAIFDTKTKEITFQNNAQPYCCDFILELNRYGQTINIEGMTFGMSVKLNDMTVLEKSFPQFGTKYLTTNQDELLSERILNFLPDTECKLSIWMSNSQGNFFNNISFIVPRPHKNFVSWIWNSEKLSWESPVTYPEDNKNIYAWDEDLYQSDNTKGWILVERS